MKVTIVVPGRFHAFDLAAGLEKMGVLHRLVTTHPRFMTRKWSIPDKKVISLPLKLCCQKIAYALTGNRSIPNLEFIFSRIFAKQAARFLDGSDILHLWSGSSEESLQYARNRNIPVVLERSSSHILTQCELLSEEYRLLGIKPVNTHPQIVGQEIREYELATKIAVPSTFVKDSFIARGFSPERLYYNPFGVDRSSFLPGAKRDGIFRVIFSGNLSVQKGVHYLIKAFLDLPQGELLLFGSKTNETKDLFKNNFKQIKCMGHVPQQELCHHYQQGSVFVLPSIQEGMAVVQAQALACGLPLICTTNTGGEDLLRLSNQAPRYLNNNILEYPAGFVVPIRDSKAIFECLSLLQNNDQLLKAKGEEALRIGVDELDWDHYAKRAMTLYQGLYSR